ncbi:hypothetical protein, partial [Gordonia sp. NPDC003585]|uniref:hypothetical protein n=1 Tax=Gordonia sp. NPDC003585 TaxID=3154275 RepID=UPI0033A0BDFF
TAPSRNSRSYFFRFSGIVLLIIDASTVRGEPHFIDGMSASMISVAVVLLVAAIGCALKAPRQQPDSDAADNR